MKKGLPNVVVAILALALIALVAAIKGFEAYRKVEYYAAVEVARSVHELRFGRGDKPQFLGELLDAGMLKKHAFKSHVDGGWIKNGWHYQVWLRLPEQDDEEAQEWKTQAGISSRDFRIGAAWKLTVRALEPSEDYPNNEFTIGDDGEITPAATVGVGGATTGG